MPLSSMPRSHQSFWADNFCGCCCHMTAPKHRQQGLNAFCIDFNSSSNKKKKKSIGSSKNLSSKFILRAFVSCWAKGECLNKGVRVCVLLSCCTMHLRQCKTINRWFLVNSSGVFVFAVLSLSLFLSCSCIEECTASDMLDKFPMQTTYVMAGESWAEY